MPTNTRRPLLPILAACFLASACSLLPDSSPEHTGGSDQEKAALNLQMGVRYLEMNMLEVAQEKLETAYRLDSSNPEVLNALAVFYERLKNDEKAADFYQAALDNDPGNYSIKNNYGHFLCERGKREKGMVLLQEAYQSPMNQRQWLAMTNIGICLQQQNDKQQSEMFFRRALEANSEYTPALLEMLKISYHGQQYMSARAFLERLLSASKPSPETLWFGFQTERALGNRQAAEGYKEQLLTSFPTSTEAQQVKSAINK